MEKYQNLCLQIQAPNIKERLGKGKEAATKHISQK